MRQFSLNFLFFCFSESFFGIFLILELCFDYNPGSFSTINTVFSKGLKKFDLVKNQKGCLGLGSSNFFDAGPATSKNEITSKMVKKMTQK